MKASGGTAMTEPYRNKVAVCGPSIPAFDGLCILNLSKIGPDHSVCFRCFSRTARTFDSGSPYSDRPIRNIFIEDHADYAMLFAYNYFDEVMKKEQDFIKRGGRFILPLPEPRIVEP